MKTNCTAQDRGYDPSHPAVRVVMCEAPPTQLRGPFDSPLERKRAGLWHNAARNELLARQITALAERRIEFLWDCGCLLDCSDLPQRDWLAVLAESREHARTLQMLLPDWDLWHMVPDSRAVPSVPWVAGSIRMVLTMAAAAVMPLFEPDALVVAHGGHWADLAANAAEARGQQCLVLDVADDFDQGAYDETCSRLRHYHARGWKIDAPKRWKPWQEDEYSG